MSLPWMAFDVADYLSDTGHLTTAQHGAYLLLIMHYWKRGALPDADDQLAAITRMTPANWRQAKPTIQGFFYDGWKHGRIERELAKAAEISSKRSVAALRMHAMKDASAEQKHTHLHLHKQEPKKEGATKPVKKDRRRATQIHDERKPNYDLSLKANLTQAETDREFAKFVNHAKANGRTCINWDAAEQNWYFKSAEFMGRKPPNPVALVSSKIFVDGDDPAFAAWEAFEGRKIPKNRNGGWYFDSHFPPAEAAE